MQFYYLFEYQIIKDTIIYKCYHPTHPKGQSVLNMSRANPTSTFRLALTQRFIACGNNTLFTKPMTDLCWQCQKIKEA